MSRRVGKVRKDPSVLVPPDRRTLRSGVTSREVFDHALELVVALLAIVPLGRFTSRDLAAVLLTAAARKVSIHQACFDLLGAPYDGTVRYHLAKLSFDDIERRLNDLLWRTAAPRLAGKAVRIAFDLTLIPYHGLPKLHKREVKKSAAKHGTSHFHAYATAYVMMRGRRFTLACLFVPSDERLAGTVERLLNLLATRDMRVSALFLDRGFYCAEVCDMLRGRRIPFMMAVPAKGKQLKRLLKTRKSYETTYTVRGKDRRGRSVAFTSRLCIVKKYRTGRMKRGKSFLYLVDGVPVALSGVKDLYRLRFGVETSYRVMNVCRGRTSSRDIRLRLLYVGISLLVQNAWVATKWERFGTPCRGRIGRKLHERAFPLQSMLRMIVRVIEAAWDARDKVTLDPKGVAPV